MRERELSSGEICPMHVFTPAIALLTIGITAHNGSSSAFIC